MYIYRACYSYSAAASAACSVGRGRGKPASTPTTPCVRRRRTTTTTGGTLPLTHQFVPIHAPLVQRIAQPLRHPHRISPCVVPARVPSPLASNQPPAADALCRRDHRRCSRRIRGGGNAGEDRLGPDGGGVGAECHTCTCVDRRSHRRRAWSRGPRCRADPSTPACTAWAPRLRTPPRGNGRRRGR